MPLSPDPPPWPNGSAPPQTYEYTVGSVSGSDPYQGISVTLNLYGQEGWSLIAVAGHSLIFKRPYSAAAGRPVLRRD